MSAGDVRRLPDYQGTTLEQRAAMIEWVRQNGLDPARIIADGIVVDLDARVIRYQEYVGKDAPGAWQPGRNSASRRSATAPLLVDPPPAVFGEPAPRYAPSPSYDWARYERTCAPDRQLDGLGDLCLFLGGTWAESPHGASFIGVLLMLIEKGQSNPERFHALAAAFPREVTAWLAWRHTSPTPTAAELSAVLIANDNRREALRALADATPLNLAAVLGGAYAGETGGPSSCKTRVCRRSPAVGLLVCCVPCRSAPEGRHGPHTEVCDRRHIESLGVEAVKAGE